MYATNKLSGQIELFLWLYLLLLPLVALINFNWQ